MSVEIIGSLIVASRTCWNCGKVAHQTLSSSEQGLPAKQPVVGVGDATRSAAFACDECGVLSIAFSQPGWRPTHSNTGVANDFRHISNLIWFPKRVEGAEFPNVPDPIASVASEAYACFSIDAYRAAVLLARTVVEATAKAQGIVSGNLASKIKEMAEKQLIRPSIKEAADEIRLLGNDMAHGDIDVPITTEDASEILELMSVVLTEVYELPAKLEARKQARLARTGE